MFNRCGETAKEYDLIFGHHNHDFEFWPINDQIPYDILLNETDEKLVNFQLDLYWIRKGNADAFHYINNFPGRFPIWHVKDMDDSQERFFTEVGSGIIDWKKIFQNKNLSGMQYFYIEQDEFRKYTPLESVKMSYDYLKKLKF